jgi:hypothetical protein
MGDSLQSEWDVLTLRGGGSLFSFLKDKVCLVLGSVLSMKSLAN